MEIWKGKFQSDTYSFIYGRLRTQLKPLDQFGYKTKVIVQFDGFAALISTIFSSYMEPTVEVYDAKKFKTQIGKAEVEFFIDTPLTKNTKHVSGRYVSQVASSNYRSTGKFTLEKQE